MNGESKEVTGVVKNIWGMGGGTNKKKTTQKTPDSSLTLPVIYVFMSSTKNMIEINAGVDDAFWFVTTDRSLTASSSFVSKERRLLLLL